MPQPEGAGGLPCRCVSRAVGASRRAGQPLLCWACARVSLLVTCTPSPEEEAQPARHTPSDTTCEWSASALASPGNRPRATPARLTERLRQMRHAAEPPAVTVLWTTNDASLQGRSGPTTQGHSLPF